MRTFLRRRWFAFALGFLTLLGSLISRRVMAAELQPVDSLSADVIRRVDDAVPPAPPEFQRIERGWLTLEFPASVRPRIDPLVRAANAFRVRISADLGQSVLSHALVRIARSPAQMAELAPRGAPPPPYASGVAYPAEHVAILSLQNPGTWEAPDLDELLQHELCHLALSDATSDLRVSRWFDEGLAIRESGELPWKRRVALMNASLAHRLIPLAEIEQRFPDDDPGVALAYAESADFVRFLMRDSDRVRFGSLIERVRSGVAFDRALDDAYGVDVRKLEYEWREDVARRYGILPLVTSGGVLWTGVVALAAIAWFKRRLRARAKLAEWAAEEEARIQPARPRDETRTELSTATPHAVPAVEPSSLSGNGAGVVEYEGRYYTIH